MIDFSDLKKLTIGGVELKQLFINGVQVWKAISFTNLVPLSTDTDGTIYNGTGYKDNVRLSSSGGISSSAQNGSTTTGFIPFGGDTDIIRLKGVEWIYAKTNYTGHYYFNFYDSNKKFLTYISSQAIEDLSHIITGVRDENGIETFDFNESYGTTNSTLQLIRQASYIRITAYGKGADMIVTINEEIA